MICLIVAVCLCSCNHSRKTQTIQNVDGTYFDVIEIDSCEYVIGNFGYKGYMAHKGNCKYCEQRRKENYGRMARP